MREYEEKKRRKRESEKEMRIKRCVNQLIFNHENELTSAKGDLCEKV